MIEYILYNTLIYGTIAFLLASWYAYGKFVNLSLMSWLIVLLYVFNSFLTDWITAKAVLFGVAMMVVYFVVHRIILTHFTNELQRDLFWLIFTLGAALFIENMVNLTFWPTPISNDLFSIWPSFLVGSLIIINILLRHTFESSYLGKLRKGIANSATTIRALWVSVSWWLQWYLRSSVPVLFTLWILITNHTALKASDNLFYLIKWIGLMILVGIDNKQYMYLWALLYVILEYLLFVTFSLPIGYKETLILCIILLVLMIKPTGLFSIYIRKN